MEYLCKVGTLGGRVASRTEEAASELELRTRLTAQGLYVFSVRPKEALGGRLVGFRRGKILADDFLIFNQQFLTLPKSALPLHKSLELLVHLTRSQGFLL